MKKGTKKQTSGAKVKDQRIFITKAELATHIGCHINTIDRWIAKGTIPPPHSRPGYGHAIWLRKHFNVYADSGEWPQDAFRIASARP
jgi:hypothetical protein